MLLILLPLVMVACKKELVDTSKNSINDATSLSSFNEEIAEGTAMVFFHAVWCEKCEELRPTVEKLSEASDLENVKFIEVDYDETRDIFTSYKVEGFPQLLFFVDGVEQERLVGKNQTEQGIRDILAKYE